MKILFVNNFRGRGGGEEFLRDLLPGLVQKGVKVGLVCRPGTPLVEMFRDSAIRVYPIERSGVGFVTSVFRIARIIVRDEYELINIQRGHDIIQSWIGSLLSGKRPVLMYTVQVPEFMKSRFLLGRMDRIISVSRSIAEKVQSFSPATSGKMAIINYGIDLSKFKPGNVKPGFLRKRFGLSPDAKVIGAVGDLWKNQIEFLDALVEIRKEFPGIRFALVASESGIGQIQAFKQRALELGLSDSVLWTGRLSKEEMISFYADVDIAVSTHRNEGFGIWVLEALAMGKPVVSYNSGGIKDSLENCPAGVLVSGGPREMASAVLKILQDDKRRGNMSTAGPRWVAEKFNRERMIEDYYNFFDAMIVNGASSLFTNSSNFDTRSGKLTRPLNILQMISKNDRYGAQRVFLNQVRVLHEMGNRVVVVTRGTEGYVTDSVRAMGLPCYGIPMTGLKDLFFLRKLIKKYKINIIHTSLDRADYFGVVLSWLTRRPVVSTMHVRRQHIGLKFATKVIVSSHCQEDALKMNGIGRGKVHLMRPGIDIRLFTELDERKRTDWKQKIGVDRYSIVFSHISSLHSPKAHQVSLELTAECKKRGEKPLLIFAGGGLNGEYYESLLETIQNLDLRDNVYFTDWTPDIPEILSLSHFTLLPSINEALGMVLLEGMAAGTPIIARKGEGGAELITEYETGFLYDPHEGVPSLAEKIVDLFRDPIRYQYLSKRCKKIAHDEFSMNRFGHQLTLLYRSVIGFKELRGSIKDAHKTGKPLNILQIISKNDKYGAQRIFLDQINVLNRMANRLVVVGRGNQGYVPDQVRAMGIEYHGIPLSGLKDFFYLRELIKNYKIDVIHTTLDRADIFGVLLSQFSNVPVICTMMVLRYHMGFKFADRVVVLSRKQARLLEKEGVRPEKIIIIRPGIDVERFANPDPEKRDTWQRKLETDKFNLVFCHIASMIPRKAHILSLQLIAECKKRGENPLLIIIGDPLHGEYYNLLIKEISDSGLDGNVYFTGWTPDIPEILALSHFTLLPSENEALGIVLMEGMAAGTPIIAREGEGGAELIEEHGTGFLYNPERGLQPLTQNIIALRRDSAKYQALSEKCRKTAQSEFSLERFGQELENVYRSSWEWIQLL